MSLQSDTDAAIALSRFGLGATPAGIAALGADPRAALRAEIDERRLPMPTGPELKSTPELMAELYVFNDARKAEREARKTAAPASPAAAPAASVMASVAPQPNAALPADKAMTPPIRAANLGGHPHPAPGPKQLADLPFPRRIFLSEVQARFNGTIQEALIGFPERLTWFWANHFAISADKGEPDRVLAGAFEREAIRPHVFGRFADMLEAVETHPAMLIFLDNQSSIGPDSKAGIRTKRGLNENLARETMELHTLGVDGGYTQADVTSLARIITGWTLVGRQARLGEPGTFAFNANAHEPGDQVLLGRTYPDRGVQQGKDALLALARHPATAHHVAFKLARHFIADQPSPALVSRLAAAFTRSDGDLTTVYRVLIEAPEAWSPKLEKVRTPLEYVFALLRASGAHPPPQRTAGALNALGQPIWAPSGPNGFADTADAWASSEGLATRIDIAAAMTGLVPGTIDPRALLKDSFGPLLTPHTLEAVSRAETRNQGLALAFLSPEFQRR